MRRAWLAGGATVELCHSRLISVPLPLAHTQASDAASFVAIDVRTPWPSAYLEWIVQLRKQAGLESTLLRCGDVALA